MRRYEKFKMSKKIHFDSRTFIHTPKDYFFLNTKLPKWEKVSQADRIAQVMWRGRTIDKEFPERDAMR